MLRLFVTALLVLLIGYHSTAEAEEWNLIGKYVNGKRTFNVNAIPVWQEKIYDELWINESTRLLMRTVNQLECWDENWFCANRYDAGPFQINTIHGRDYRHSVYLVNKWRNQIEEAKKSGNYEGVIKTRDELFKFQATWTFERMKRLARQYWKKVDYATLPREKQVWYQAVWHNGNTSLQSGREFRFWYWDKAVKHWTLLSSATKKQYAVASRVDVVELKVKEEIPDTSLDWTLKVPDAEAYVRRERLPETEGFLIP